MNGTIYFIFMLLPYVAVCALIGGFIGWHLRCRIGKCHGHTEQAVAAPTSSKPSSDDAARVKKLQEKLKQAESLNVTLKQDLDSLKTKSVSKSDLEVSNGKVFAATAELEQEKKRINTLSADLKKAQETISGLNAKLNVDVKEQKDRTFVLENELSQVREQLLRYQGATDDTAELRSELERARETASNATRFAGESRKREASLSEEIESLKAKLAKQAEVSATAAVTAAPAFVASIPAKPAGDSESVLKAKAEVERLNAERAAAEKEAALKEAAIREEAIRVAAEKAAFAKAEAERIAAEKEAAERESAQRAIAEAAAVAQAASLISAPAEKESEVVAESAPEAGTKIDLATDVLGKRVRQDDLKIIEGIGPKIEELLHGGGITTWAQLGEASVERVQEILNAAGDAYAVHNPATWPRQAAMAAAGQWSQLREWQDQLDGGKEVS